MKYLLFLLLSLTGFCSMSQNPISPVAISLPANLPAATAAWATAIPPVMITAQTKLQNGQVSGTVIESRILVTIKQGGSKVCGSYTPQTAPASNFNAATKTWSSAAVVQLLGQDCTLRPGSYELCVQFYGMGPLGNTILGEACKGFTIADSKQETYSPPQNVMPAADKQLTEQDAKGGINFRWTPVLPRQKENVTYRLKVWQLMQGQNGTQAMRSNQPIVTKDVDNITQATINNVYTGPCRPPYLCDFVWNVEAVSKEQVQGAARSFGTSESWAFSIKQNNTTGGNNPPSPAMMSGANAEFKIDSATCLQKENGLFKYHIWAHYKNMTGSSSNILLNDALNFPGYTTNPNPGIGANLRNNIRIKTLVYNPALTMNDILEASSGTISNITPVPASVLTPASLLPNSSHIFQFDYSTATNTPVQFRYFGLVDDALKFDPAKNTRNEIDSLKFPKCPCSACDEVTIAIQQGNITNNGNGSLSFATTVSSTPKKVKRIRAELVYFDMKPNDENCFACNKNSSYFGNFANATTGNANFTAVIQQPHSAQFDAAGSIDISTGIAMNFSVTIPPMVSCCNADMNFCIRYVITYEDCTVCNRLACYNYKITGCQK